MQILDRSRGIVSARIWAHLGASLGVLKVRRNSFIVMLSLAFGLGVAMEPQARLAGTSQEHSRLPPTHPPTHPRTPVHSPYSHIRAHAQL